MKRIAARHRALKTLRKVELLQGLSLAQAQRLTDLLVEESFSAGSTLATQGEVPKAFYIVDSGECSVTKSNGGWGGGGDAGVQRLGKDDTFGEQSLLYDGAASDATIVATTNVTVFYITKGLI